MAAEHSNTVAGISLREAVQFFQACSDRTRLRIIHMLSEVGEMCVADIQDVLEMSQPRVSRHLALLRHIGVVIDLRRGRWVHYALAKPPSKFHKDILKSVLGCADQSQTLQRDLEGAKTLSAKRASETARNAS